MNSILVTGSNRGLGLEWVRQYAREGWRVYATCRFPDEASELQKLAGKSNNVTVHQLDVTRADQFDKLKQAIGNSAIDLLVNNAGVYHEQWGQDPLGQINYNDWQHTFDVNALGPMRLSEAFVDNVSSSTKKLIVTITSHMGSITDIGSGKDYAYRSSKAALNASMKGLSCELAASGVGVLLLHPGWVRTRMGGESAPISVQQSVEGMRKLVAGFKFKQSGHFYRYDGSAMPW